MTKTSASTNSIINRPAKTLPSTGFVWTGTTPPSGAEDHSYILTLAERSASLHVAVSYVTAGLSLTGLTIPFQSDWPLPYIPSGFSGASVNLYTGSGRLIVALTTSVAGTNIGGCIIRANSAGTGYELFIGGTSGSQRIAIADITYPTV